MRFPFTVTDISLREISFHSCLSLFKGMMRSFKPFMRICVIIVRATVRMVTRCQNRTQPKLTTIDQLHPSQTSVPLNTPACAVKPMSLLPNIPATGIPARPQKNSDFPAAAVPMRLKARLYTSVGINRAAIKRSSPGTHSTGTRTAGKDDEHTSPYPRNAGTVHGGRRRTGALDYCAGYPHPF